MAIAFSLSLVVDLVKDPCGEKDPLRKNETAIIVRELDRCVKHFTLKNTASIDLYPFGEFL